MTNRFLDKEELPGGFNLPEILQKKNELSGAVLNKYSTIDEGLKNQLNELAQIISKTSSRNKEKQCVTCC